MDRTADALTGRVLDGRYRVGAKIARGGMATIYEAVDLRLDRTVAVKVMHESLGDDEEFIRRFEREARSAARLAHHNVVSVFDTGEDAGTLFLVMEYVPGLTLRDLIRKEAPMSPTKALGVIEPVLSALAAAHDAGLIHRDVKPENVLLADDGRVKVADFGLARAVNAETQHTASGGVLIGTVSYLSPELVVDGRADARADVYATGVLIYEMLTGQKPHQADNPIQVAYKHVHEDVPAPSASVPDIPDYVDALVARATARDPEIRPADARVLLHQVRRVRTALAQGIAEDADLVADLAPSRSGGRTPTGELPSVILDPQQVPDALEDTGGRLDDYRAADFYDHESDTGFVPLAATTTVAMPAPDEATTTVATGPRADLPPISRSLHPTSPPPAPPAGAAGAPVPVPPPRRRSRRGPLLLAAVLAIAIAVGIGGWYFGIARYTTTPGVINQPQAAAQEKVEAAGLSFEIVQEDYSESVARGAVISTEPGAGDRIAQGGTISAVVSRGPERYAVPKLEGRTLDDAQAALADANLAFGDTIRRYHPTLPKGSVITTDPKPEAQLKRDTAVDVVLSRGPKPIAIPNFTNKPAAAAEKTLTELGFKVSASETFHDSVPAGAVISQSPDQGNGFKGDTVNLSVSKGAEQVAVPGGLEGQTFEAAKQAVEAAGLKAAESRSPLHIGAGLVVSVSPAPGTKVPRGSTVTLTTV